MRWLLVLAAVGAAVVALQVLIWERSGGRSRPSLVGRLALATLTLVVFGAVVYMAHWFGIFSIPLVIIAFVPFGVAARWLILGTRGARGRLADARAATLPLPSRSDRLLAAAAIPVFVLLVAAVLALGLVSGTLVGMH